MKHFILSLICVLLSSSALASEPVCFQKMSKEITPEIDDVLCFDEFQLQKAEDDSYSLGIRYDSRKIDVQLNFLREADKLKYQGLTGVTTTWRTSQYYPHHLEISQSSYLFHVVTSGDREETAYRMIAGVSLNNEDGISVTTGYNGDKCAGSPGFTLSMKSCWPSFCQDGYFIPYCQIK